MKKLSSLILLGILLQGCTSIDQPVASRALVDHDYAIQTAPVSAEQQTILSQTYHANTVQLDGKPAILGKPFFAASGRTCRKVQFIVDGQRVFCKTTEGDWYPIVPVLASYSEAVTGGEQ
ncbi:DVU3141 family protein [Aliiglaciecola lipolytica]|uniref:Lipoprotein n=1 Tax=Aliiglaciecola lipolytica E3 TaxID=1127673 RepID=K6WXY7_9ALTE|nr:DVU3141 family protein [Aliiglaciecola lipolytica]GAC13304.1 hypothetical protein GLIP_0658 [Aliiglaciecola lipolytica E3]